MPWGFIEIDTSALSFFNVRKKKFPFYLDAFHHQCVDLPGQLVTSMRDCHIITTQHTLRYDLWPPFLGQHHHLPFECCKGSNTWKTVGRGYIEYSMQELKPALSILSTAYEVPTLGGLLGFSRAAVSLLPMGGVFWSLLALRPMGRIGWAKYKRMLWALNRLTKVQDDLAKVSKSQKTCKSCTLIHRAEPGVSSQHKTPSMTYWEKTYRHAYNQ